MNEAVDRTWIFPGDSGQFVPYLKILSVDSFKMNAQLLRGENGKTESYTFVRPSALKPAGNELKEFGFETSVCFGKCPVAKISIRQDSVFYNGVRYVPDTGLYAGKTDPEFWNRMKVLFTFPDLTNEDTTRLNNAVDDSDVSYYFITSTDTLRFCCERVPKRPELTAMIRLAACYAYTLKTSR
jgi:hypothetical protein